MNNTETVKLCNQPCYDKDGNFIGWFSRSIAVVGLIFGLNKDGEWCVLASERGQGTPDPEFVGAWNVCCGYLDYNETVEEAIAREVYEEVGIKLLPESFGLFNVNSDPKSDKRQNVTFRFINILDKPIEEYTKQFSHEHNEKDEVGCIDFIPISKINEYRWAFNHLALINYVFETIPKSVKNDTNN